jgi:hypothetical protein
LDALGRILRDGFDDLGVREVVRLAQGVGGVLLPGVLRVHRAERGVDAARGEGRVRVVLATLAHREYLDAALRELDRHAQAGAAGADHEDRGSEKTFWMLRNCCHARQVRSA